MLHFTERKTVVKADQVVGSMLSCQWAFDNGAADAMISADIDHENYEYTEPADSADERFMTFLDGIW